MMRNELIDLYKMAMADHNDKDVVRAYQRARDRIGPMIVMDEVLTCDELRASLERLKTALDIIQSGFEFRSGDPKMDGTFESHPHLLSRGRMIWIAREALAKLEEK
jgi:hypothetical protein